MTDLKDHPDSIKLMQQMRQYAGQSRQLSFHDFMKLALYDPELGYYRKKATRVGKTNESDFYTSQSIGRVFGALVFDAIQEIVEDFFQTTDLESYTLVEVGYETEATWWHAEDCPFGKVLRIGPGDPIDFSENCVVFSNELWDAQPFNRVVYFDGRWQELGVDISQDPPKEVILSEPSPELRAMQHQLPLHAEEGYILDLPVATRSLLAELMAPNWQGLFVALDYGKTWEALTQDLPQGTARAYYKHKQSPNLLAQPGMQDITCHICWDWLIEGLQSSGFQNVTLESQEAFFVKHAGNQIKTIVEANTGKFDPDRQSLMQLIHPSTMGQQFQVLWGYR